MRRPVAATLTAAVAITVAAVGTTVAVAQGGAGNSPEALVDRLVAVEREAPALPPSAVLVDDETTWGELTGDFVSAQLSLELMLDEMTELFVDADDANGPVADAVASVARSYLELQEAYSYLAVYEQEGLGLPVGTTDDFDVATGADEVRGLAEVGLDVLLGARERALGGYLVLRDAAEADATEKSLFDAAYRETDRFLREDAALLHEMLSLPTLSVISVTGRFGSTAPGSQAPARSMTIACIDRDVYPGTAADPLEALRELATGELQAETLDCPDLANDNAVTPNLG